MVWMLIAGISIIFASVAGYSLIPLSLSPFLFVYFQLIVFPHAHPHLHTGALAQSSGSAYSRVSERSSQKNEREFSEEERDVWWGGGEEEEERERENERVSGMAPIDM